MTADRGRVRIIALLWLLCQAGSLAAFVPENCCLSHAEEATARQQPEPCHEGEPVKASPGRCLPDGPRQRRRVP